MDEWVYAQSDPAQKLARLYYFAVNKLQDGAEIEFKITVRELATPKEGAMRFFAQADKETNQKVAAYTPSGWGKTLLDALSDCVREINRFPYHADKGQVAEA